MSPTTTAEQKPTPKTDPQPETSIYSSAGDGTPKAQRYRFINAISESQTSSVWRARDTLTGTDVAVKRLTGSIDDVARQRLAEEAQVSDRVSHPGLVPVLDSWFEPGESALVFPFVPGQTLAQRLHEMGPLSPRDATTIALELADILAATHEAQLIHRDVKPGNVLLAADGRTRLVDFGISSSGDVDEGSLELTGSGMAIGTLPYMAPEQLTGGTPTTAVDVYALGIVLYEMLSGTRPYNGKSPTEQLQLQQSPPPPLTAPAAITALVLAALDPIPEQRPSAEQLGRSLRAWLDGRLDTDAPTALVAAAALSTPAQSGSRGESRSRRLVGAAMVAAAAVGLAALAALALGGSTNSLDDQPSNVPLVAVRSEPSVSPGPAEASATPTTTQPTAPPIATVPSDGRSAVSNAAPGPQNHGADPHVKHKHHHGHHKHHRHGQHGHG